MCGNLRVEFLPFGILVCGICVWNFWCVEIFRVEFLLRGNLRVGFLACGILRMEFLAVNFDCWILILPVEFLFVKL